MIPHILAAMRADAVPAGESGRWQVFKGFVSPKDSESMRRLKKKNLCEFVPPGSYTWLFCRTLATLNAAHSETVMNDFPSETRKHLQFILRARGRVLVLGLGLGCVVRGLLAHGRVKSIDVVERSPDVLRLCAASVQDPRVAIHGMDARQGLPTGSWDYGWSDLWSDPEKDEPHLQVIHAEMITKLEFGNRVRFQGAWKLPRWFLRRYRSRGLLRMGGEVS
jgi:hypothetical protein